MAKLVIGQAPATFDLETKVPTPSGEAEINWTAKHMPMTDWAGMRDAHTEEVEKEVKALIDAARKKAEAEYAKQAKKAGKEDVPVEEKEAAINALFKMPKNKELVEIKARLAGKLLVQMFDAWDLDDEFSEATLVKMCDLYPKASEVIIQGYDDKLAGRKLGNLKK